ncbi:MAG: hypothetical protein IT423_17595 [Pirellulaceae bacterium]|nr:hypothetical protein [Pirellulaceae bacterium]
MPKRIVVALGELHDAYVYAQETSGNKWEFATEIERLKELGLHNNDLRWLVRMGLVKHMREVTQEEEDGRTFRPTGDLVFPAGSCFVLTEDGVSVASFETPLERTNRVPSLNHHSTFGSLRDSLGHHASECNLDCHVQRPGETQGNQCDVLPKWDADRRTLSFKGLLVKHFKWEAANQEAVLSVFEEESWPARIDDPLPLQPEQDAKRRLSDTIKCLNRKQHNRVIHFRGDGTGEGVLWEVVSN